MSATYINTTCKVGQSEPCGKPAAWAIAVTEVADNAWVDEGRTGGVVALCEFHATTPVTEWDASPSETPGTRSQRIRDAVERSSFGTAAAKAARESVTDEAVARVLKRAAELAISDDIWCEECNAWHPEVVCHPSGPRDSRAPWAHHFMAVDDSDECGICGVSADEENHHDPSLFKGDQ